MERRFATVVVEEPSQEAALEILKGVRPRYEEHHKVKISDEALEAAVHLSSRYITKRFLPDKAIDLMDEAAARLRNRQSRKKRQVAGFEQRIVRNRQETREQALLDEKFEEAAKLRNQALETKEKIAQIEEAKRKKDEKKEYAGIVSAEDVATVVSEWTGVPVTQLTKTESERLINLEKFCISALSVKMKLSRPCRKQSDVQEAVCLIRLAQSGHSCFLDRQASERPSLPRLWQKQCLVRKMP